MRVAALKAVVMPWQAVLGGLARVGHAQVALVADPRQAKAASVGAVETARHLAPALPAAAHAVVARVACQPFDVYSQVACTAGELDGAGFLARGAAQAQLSAALVALLRDGRGNLVVQHVDHAANGAAAVDQRRRASQHFDLARQQGFCHHGVVRADGGGILHLRAVGQHLHARAVHAANHRAAGTSAEVARLDARLAVQGFAQRAFAPAYQLIPLQHAHRRGHVVATQLQPTGGDGDFGQRSRRVLRLGLCLLPQSGDEQGHGQGGGCLRSVECARTGGVERNGVRNVLHGQKISRRRPTPVQDGRRSAL